MRAVQIELRELNIENPDPMGVETVIEYHQRTKHHPDRYARSLGYMDWANQPDPFRRFPGATQYDLEHPPPSDSPPYAEIFMPGKITASPLDFRSVSRLLYDSLALSAWKQAPGAGRWSLRVNPSSGNLHPTEAYLICGGMAGLAEAPAVYHYSPYNHSLELRFPLGADLWNELTVSPTNDIVFVALSSIYWRESWKYGERAFRYCHHDVGHAVGAISLSGSALGWQSMLTNSIPDDQLEILLGIHRQEGPEAEHVDCLIRLSARDTATEEPAVTPALLTALARINPEGTPNRLSREHHPWPVIDEISEITRFSGTEYSGPSHTDQNRSPETRVLSQGRDPLTARQLFRQRRSAIAMNGDTHLASEEFFHIMQQSLAGHEKVPFSSLQWDPCISLAVFVHRIDGLAPGLYCLVRNPSHEGSLRSSFHPEFEWTNPPGCPEDLPLYQLKAGDYRETARSVSCFQEIASEGAFSVGMLALFEPSLRQFGAWFYPRLFWETGLVGQVLYLEAEASGIRATGIGCFHDDMMHQILGIADLTWQSLYHFTVGGALEDFRLQTVPAYAHLGK
jgi:SagB-type dehydrogenase family enzyme